MWYELNGVEYSTNFKFFLENQVFVTLKSKVKVDSFYLNTRLKNRIVEETTPISKNKEYVLYHYGVCSRLESRVFQEIHSIDKEGQIEELRQIHTNLLMGKYGKGKFVA